MKRVLIAITLSIATVAFAQDGIPVFTVPVQPQPKTVATVDSLGSQISDVLFGPGMTNLSLTGGGTYSTGTRQWGEFALLTRNVPLGGGVGVGISAGIDHYNHAFYAVSGQVSLSATLMPFASLFTNTTGVLGYVHNLRVTPLGFLGVGTPFGGGSQSTSSPETIQGTGATVDLVNLGQGFHLSALGLYGTRQGIGTASGTFYGAGLTLSKLF
jgi:hypothetical protein